MTLAGSKCIMVKPLAQPILALTKQFNLILNFIQYFENYAYVKYSNKTEQLVRAITIHVHEPVKATNLGTLTSPKDNELLLLPAVP